MEDDHAAAEPLRTEEEAKKPSGGWRLFRPTVEPLVALFMFSFVTSSSVTPGLFLERACGSSNTSGCAGDAVRHSTALLMWKSVLEAVVPAAVCPFLGSWSDRYGRKPLFLWAFAGNFLSHVASTALSAVPALPAEWLLLPPVLSSFSGGMFNLLALANVYVADICPPDERELRLGVLDTCQYLSMMLGLGLAAPIFIAASFPGVYGVAAACMLVSFLYTLLLLPESKPLEPTARGVGHSCGELFSPKLVREAMSSALRPRPHHGRAVILIIIAVVVTSIFIMQGEGNVNYLFVNKRFGWTVQDSQLYGFFGSGMTAIGTLAGVLVLVRLLRLPDAAIAALTFICKVTGAVLQAVSPQPWFLYLGSALSAVGGMVWVLARTMLTRIVGKDEIGKVFALSVTVEAVVPLMAAPVYTGVFAASMDSFPGAFHLLSAGVMLLDMLLMLVATYLNRGVTETPEKKKPELQLD